MFGIDVHRLRVLLIPLSEAESSGTVVLQKDGNYGDNWNYGQVTLNLTTEARVSDITQGSNSLILVNSRMIAE